MERLLRRSFRSWFSRLLRLLLRCRLFLRLLNVHFLRTTSAATTSSATTSTAASISTTRLRRISRYPWAWPARLPRPSGTRCGTFEAPRPDNRAWIGNGAKPTFEAAMISNCNSRPSSFIPEYSRAYGQSVRSVVEDYFTRTLGLTIRTVVQTRLFQASDGGKEILLFDKVAN